MTDLRTAAQQAQDALFVAREFAELYDTEHAAWVNEKCHDAITDLKAALAEPVQEPVQEPVEEPVEEPLGWAVQVGTHGGGRRRGKPRYTIFFDKAAAENLAYRTGTHPKPFYIGGNDD